MKYDDSFICIYELIGWKKRSKYSNVCCKLNHIFLTNKTSLIWILCPALEKIKMVLRLAVV